MLTLPGGQCRILMPRGPSRQPARSCCILPLLSRLLALRPLPWRPLLLDAAGQAAAPVRTLHRDVLFARHSLVLVAALSLARRHRRPLLDALAAPGAAVVALERPSDLAAVASRAIAVRPDAPYSRPLSLLLPLACQNQLA